jgi:chromosome segregation ATPase
MAGTQEENERDPAWLAEQAARLRTEADTVNRESAAVKAECQALRVQLQNAEAARDKAEQAAKIAAEKLVKANEAAAAHAKQVGDLSRDVDSMSGKVLKVIKLAKDRRIALYDMSQELAKLQRRLADLLTDVPEEPEPGRPRE